MSSKAGPTAAAELNSALLSCIRDALRPAVGSTVVVDWTALNHACVLLEGNLWVPASSAEQLTFGGTVEPTNFPAGAGRYHYDPFIALADLATVAAAVILHDRLLAVTAPAHPIAERATRALQLHDGVIRELRTDVIGSGGDDRVNSLIELLNGAWMDARATVAAGEQFGRPWFQALRDSWSYALPTVEFPSHSADGVDEVMPDPQYGASPAGEPPAIFTNAWDAWEFKPDQYLAAVVIDNDIRALFYELLVDQLIELGDEGGRAPRLRYLGGTLRAPLQIAYANAFSHRKAKIPVEQRLQSAWLDQGGPTELPLWLTAILATAPDSPADVAAQIAAWREKARRFRDRRAELESALERGDRKTGKKVLAALQSDLKALTGGAFDTGVEVVQAAAELVGAPAPAASAGSAVAKKLSAPVEMAWLRYRQPQLWLIADMGVRAGMGVNSVRNAARAFAFPEHLMDEIPVAFLNRLGHLASVN
ncbi:MAG TPA: hypothetical protein VFG79_13035 [Solirubrobacter sp.]|nr:hypothetical protein [Solirubrobacter sp.]